MTTIVGGTNPMYQGRYSALGFTLVELMVVLAIIAIAAIIAAPSYIQFIKQDRIVNHANQLHSVFKFARSEAVKRERAINLRATAEQWQVIANPGEANEAVLRAFTKQHSSLTIALPNRIVAITGELNNAANILITDNDASTTDYRLCVLRSGQSWLAEEGEACV
ncbi:GspH/FimT family pseudopilin [Pseudoalteromonas sp. CO325X]|uniref:GspH/FimT family pseudopilin n=1 Tax=Pseudoalteromonas sp. CO325X TaxID=1777262 RepID=UPI001F108A3D|nr:GspH/FimT family pseudopilin [Pseudoalteromonas sp. CO325X]